jgi:hypothetical protein
MRRDVMHHDMEQRDMVRHHRDAASRHEAITAAYPLFLWVTLNLAQSKSSPISTIVEGIRT